MRLTEINKGNISRVYKLADVPGVVVDRFKSKLIKTDGCWFLKHGAILNRYSSVRHKTIHYLGHRISFVLFRGEIGYGLVIDHLCNVPACVNPNHLEAKTSIENTLRGDSPISRNKWKTHCKRGHELSGYNLMVEKRGRACRACRVAQTKRWRAAHPGMS